MAYGSTIEVMGVPIDPPRIRVYGATAEKLWYLATHIQGLGDADGWHFKAPEGTEEIIDAINRVDISACRAPWVTMSGTVARDPEFQGDA
jgi:hypothetical protein